MKSSINKVTGLQAGFTTEWVVLHNGVWRALTADELVLVEADYSNQQLIAIKAGIESAIQSMLDAKAKELRYDNMMSARSYAGFDNQFQREAQALAAWCANCWLVAGQMEASGETYTVEEVLAQMPEFAQ